MGHGLEVHRFEPPVGLCADSAEPAWDSLPLSLSLKINRNQKSIKQIKPLPIKKKKRDGFIFALYLSVKEFDESKYCGMLNFGFTIERLLQS